MQGNVSMTECHARSVHTIYYMVSHMLMTDKADSKFDAMLGLFKLTQHDMSHDA